MSTPRQNAYVAFRRVRGFDWPVARFLSEDLSTALPFALARYGSDVGVWPWKAYLEWLKQGGALQHALRMEKATEDAA